MRQLGLQPAEGFLLRSLLVPADQVTDVFADVLVRPVIADIGGYEVAQGPTKADGHRCRSGHRAAPVILPVFNITNKAHRTSV